MPASKPTHRTTGTGPESSSRVLLPADWQAAFAAEFDEPYFQNLEEFLANPTIEERRQSWRMTTFPLRHQSRLTVLGRMRPLRWPQS